MLEQNEVVIDLEELVARLERLEVAVFGEVAPSVPETDADNVSEETAHE
jgi:hypothetical protein